MAKTTDSVALREWMVIGRLDDFEPGAAKRTRLLGQEIECLRRRDGALVVHEIQMDGSTGESLFTCERYCHVWVTFSAEPRPMIEMPEFSDPKRRTIEWGGVMVRTSPQRLVENFLDMGHFAFVHTDMLGAEPHTEILDYKVETKPELGEVWSIDCRAYQPKSSTAAGTGRDVEYIYRTSGPFVVVLYKTAEKPGTFDVIGMLVQPMDEDHCRVFGVTLLLEHDTDPVEALHFQQTIFLQDRLILEQQTPRRLPLHDRSETPARADAGAIAYRRMLLDSGIRFGIQPKAS